VFKAIHCPSSFIYIQPVSVAIVFKANLVPVLFNTKGSFIDSRAKRKTHVVHARVSKMLGPVIVSAETSGGIKAGVGDPFDLLDQYPPSHPAISSDSIMSSKS
jgi:hypothetical protein